MLWTIFLLFNGLLILVLLYSTRTRQKDEPPLDKGFIPWLGHALEFGKDAAKFLAWMKEKHGDIFTVRIAGFYVTVLLDPNSFDAVVNDTECLDVTQGRNQLQRRIFGLQLPSIRPADERKWTEQHFQGGNLSELSASMNTNLRSLLQSDLRDDGSQWRQEGLFSLCYSLLFRAGYLTLFGGRDNGAEIYREFRTFDSLLTKMAFCRLSRGESRTANSTRENLWRLLSPGCLSDESCTSSWHQGYLKFLQLHGVDAEMQNRALLLQLWTTQCNAGPAAFWLLGFLLTHPQAMEAVKSEVRHLTSRKSNLQPCPTDSLEAHSTPVLDSALTETLRLTAAVMIKREVVRDKRLRMASGQEYRLRQGDRVCLFPFLSPQMDPQIHKDPQVFKYDRFLNDNKTMKDEFYKEQRRLKYYTLPWGAGKNVCVGKDFAVTTIKQFVLLLLTHLDVEMCNPEDKLPPVNPSRYGFGMLHPDGDLAVRYRQMHTL